MSDTVPVNDTPSTGLLPESDTTKERLTSSSEVRPIAGRLKTRGESLGLSFVGALI